MLYLNRRGQPEGPYSETEIAVMIRGGNLREGWVAQQGQSQWVPLRSVPALAQALADAKAPLAGTSQPMAGPPDDLSPPEGAQPDANGAGAAEPLPPSPQGHDAALKPGTLDTSRTQGAPRAPSGSTSQPSRLPLVLGLGIVALVLTAAAAWATYSFLFIANGPRIAELIPQDTQAYIEIPNIRAAAAALREARYLKGSGNDDDWLQAQARTVAESFGIDASAALALALAQHSVGVSISALEEKPRVGVLLQFDAAGPVEALLKSERFKVEGDLGDSGKRYSLSEKKGGPPKGEGWTAALRRMLDSAKTKTDLSLGWWESSHLLALGNPSVLASLAAVQDGTSSPLSELERFQQAMDTPSSSSTLVGWLDGKAAQKILEKQSEFSINLRDEGAVLSVSGKDAGVLMHLVTTIVGSDVAQTPLFFVPGTLTYPKTLPRQTVAYTALSTRTSLDGAGLEREFRALLQRKRPGSVEELQRAEALLKTTTGVSLAEALGCIGDELVLGAMMPTEMKLTSLDPEQLRRAGAFAALRLNDPDIAEILVAYLRDKVLTETMPGAVTPKGKAMIVNLPMGPDTVVEVRFVQNQLILAGGAKKMVDAAFDAFAGKGSTLGQDAGHTAVLSSLPERNGQIVWLDTGRLAEALLQSKPPMRAMAMAAGIPLDAIELSGPRRITSAAAVSIVRHQQAWQLQIDTTNLVPGLALLGGASAVGARARFDAMMGAPPGGNSLVRGAPDNDCSGSGAGAGAGAGSGTGSGSGSGACTEAVACCRALMSRTQKATSATCDTLAMALPASCTQALNGYHQAVTSVGGRCD